MLRPPFHLKGFRRPARPFQVQREVFFIRSFAPIPALFYEKRPEEQKSSLPKHQKDDKIGKTDV